MNFMGEKAMTVGLLPGEMLVDASVSYAIGERMRF
jgi:hypothetical protein